MSAAAGVRASSPGMGSERREARLPGSLGSCYLDSCGVSSCWSAGQLARYESESIETRLPGSLGSCYLDSCGVSSCWGAGQLARYEAEITATS